MFSKYFSNNELACRCSICRSTNRVLNIHYQSLDDLIQFRIARGEAIFVSSGGRCHLNNDYWKDSQHAATLSHPSRAFDIYDPNMTSLEFMLEFEEWEFSTRKGRIRLPGRGIYQDSSNQFIHLDGRDSNVIIRWKRENSEYTKLEKFVA